MHRFRGNIEASYVIHNTCVICYIKGQLSKATQNFLQNMGLPVPRWDENTVAKGVAVLKPGDTNNIEVAKKIAKAKALRNYNSRWRSYYQSIYEICARQLSAYDEIITSIDLRNREIEDNIRDIANGN